MEKEAKELSTVSDESPHSALERGSISAAEARAMRVDHPEFYYVTERGVDGFPVVVFERKTYFDPTPEQVADYRHRKAIVEQHGGYMPQSEYQVGGETPAFTDADCAAMRAAVIDSLPEWTVRDSWNGTGCRSYSVSIQRASE